MSIRKCRGLMGLFLLLAFSAGAVESEWKGVERIVAVGDVHGDFERFVKVLRAAKVINHEAMIMLGDYRYRHPSEVQALGGPEGFERAMSATGKYGKWLSAHNAVVKVNGVLFVHGGISPKYAKMPLAELNGKVRKQLLEKDRSMTGPIWDPDGPLWYRGYAFTGEGQLDAVLAQVLKATKAKHIVVGHTVMKGGIRVRGDGKVVMIDVGLSKHYGGPAECLVIEGGVWYSANAKGKTKLPVPSKKTSEEPAKK